MSIDLFALVGPMRQPPRADSGKVLTLAFLRPAPDDPIMNRVTAWFSRHGFCHAELVFDGGLAFSIYSEFPAGLRARTLSNPHYELVPLLVTGGEYRACLHFCRNAGQKGIVFDNVGMVLAQLHPGCGCAERASEHAGRTFCTKIIVEALQFGGVREAEGLSPSATTPSSLYEAVRASERRVCDSVRMQRPGGVSLALQPLMSR